MPLLFVACSDDDSVNELFSIKVSEVPQYTDVSIDDADCGISTKGFAQTIVVSLVGDFDAFNISDGIVDWISVTTGQTSIALELSAFSGNEDVRSAAVGFTVFKEGESVSGRIIVHQYALTKQDFLNREREAIDLFLSTKEVVYNIPTDISEIRCGENAPYYKLDDGNVYMQVVELASGHTPTVGEQIYFRFERYNLLSNQANGGNVDNNELALSYFILGSESTETTQWGPAIQMPLLLGVPINSKVNLVVASVAGITSEINNITPYLYSIRYISGER